MAYDGPTVARIKNGKIHGSFSCCDVFNFLQRIDQFIQHHGVTAIMREFPDTLQILYPGPQPIGDKTQMLTVAAFAGAQDLPIGHCVM